MNSIIKEKNKLFQEYPSLKKINYSVLNKIHIYKFNQSFDWEEINSFDDLEFIEFIMDIEKELNIVIDDNVSDFLQKDNNFKRIFDASVCRKEVLDNLLNFTKS